MIVLSILSNEYETPNNHYSTKFKPMINRLEFPVQYSFDIDSNLIIATVPQLNYISSFGENFEEAEKNVIEAVLAYLESLEKEDLPIPQSEINSGTILRIELVA